MIRLLDLANELLLEVVSHFDNIEDVLYLQRYYRHLYQLIEPRRFEIFKALIVSCIRDTPGARRRWPGH